MGKGDIRTRRGKVWRGTYGVTRPRRYKTVIRPTTTRKVKTLKDLPNAVAESGTENSATETGSEAPKKTAAKKAPAAKKTTAKKAPETKE